MHEMALTSWATLLRYQHFHLTNFLRILARYEAEIEEIYNLCTFWPVTQLINHLFNIQ